jgi:hypothetical protein
VCIGVSSGQDSGTAVYDGSIAIGNGSRNVLRILWPKDQRRILDIFEVCLLKVQIDSKLLWII